MELLLWLWFYDTRWFFNFKISIVCYKNAWLIPLFLHSFLMIVCLYYLQISETFLCDKSLKLWLYTRTFFSFLLSITIIFFMLKIVNVNKKEINSFEIPMKIIPILENNMKQYEFWIRRKSLLSTPGILLLFLGLISMFWSYLIISLYHFQNYYFSCEIKIQKLLNTHSFFILLGNLPLFIIFVTMILFKLTSFIAAFICPNLVMNLGKKLSKREMKIELIKYC